MLAKASLIAGITGISYSCYQLLQLPNDIKLCKLAKKFNEISEKLGDLSRSAKNLDETMKPIVESNLENLKTHLAALPIIQQPLLQKEISALENLLSLKEEAEKALPRLLPHKIDTIDDCNYDAQYGKYILIATLSAVFIIGSRLCSVKKRTVSKNRDIQKIDLNALKRQKKPSAQRRKIIIPKQPSSETDSWEESFNWGKKTTSQSDSSSVSYDYEKEWADRRKKLKEGKL